MTVIPIDEYSLAIDWKDDAGPFCEADGTGPCECGFLALYPWDQWHDEVFRLRPSAGQPPFSWLGVSPVAGEVAA